MLFLNSETNPEQIYRFSNLYTEKMRGLHQFIVKIMKVYLKILQYFTFGIVHKNKKSLSKIPWSKNFFDKIF